MTSDEYYCLKGICENNEEYEAIRFLFNSLSKKYKEALHKGAEYRATIQAIEKINNGKNAGITTLCDIDNGSESNL